MFGVADYGAFVVAVIVFLCIPGPGNFALISSTGKGGFRGGMAATFRVIVGDQILMWTAVAGVAAVLIAWPVAFGAIQWLGAAYLTWIGYRMIMTKEGGAPILNVRPRRYFQQAMVITLLNPKAIVFYMAFFPLFVDPAQHQGVATFAFMAISIATLTFTYCVIVALLTRHFADRLRASPRITLMFNRIAGVFLIGFGVKLALSR